jgi:gp16 family phage-associated protein
MDERLVRVKAEFMENGVTVREWARANGFSEGLVYAILNGKNQALRGESFQIAVALGLKFKPASPPQHLRPLLLSRGT